jgi:hypothetical protein
MMSSLKRTPCRFEFAVKLDWTALAGSRARVRSMVSTDLFDDGQQLPAVLIWPEEPPTGHQGRFGIVRASMGCGVPPGLSRATPYGARKLRARRLLFKGGALTLGDFV